MTSVHQDNPLSIQFSVIEVIRSIGRRGIVDRLLLQKETSWIYRLKTVSPLCLIGGTQRSCKLSTRVGNKNLNHLLMEQIAVPRETFIGRKVVHQYLKNMTHENDRGLHQCLRELQNERAIYSP